jgi:hypothetical protein
MGRQPPEARILEAAQASSGPLLSCWPANDRLDGLGINGLRARIAPEVFALARAAIPIDPLVRRMHYLPYNLRLGVGFYQKFVAVDFG